MSPLLDYFRHPANRRNLIILIVLIVGLPIAFYLAQRTQVFKSRATNDPIVIAGPNVYTNDSGQQVIRPERTGPDGKPIYKVDLLLTAPSPSTQ